MLPIFLVPAGCFCDRLPEPRGCLCCTCLDCGAVGRFGAEIVHASTCS